MPTSDSDEQVGRVDLGKLNRNLPVFVNWEVCVECEWGLGDAGILGKQNRGALSLKPLHLPNQSLFYKDQEQGRFYAGP